MSEQAALALRSRNPDVLMCIANLSNDEVFTSPEFANQILNLVEEAWAEANDGANIWADKSVTFLDPFTKSGVFLREITSRLTEGLKDEIPDLRERVDHILTKQVFGIGITKLTSLIARRSVYCSKWANGKHSSTHVFGCRFSQLKGHTDTSRHIRGSDKMVVRVVVWDLFADGLPDAATKRTRRAATLAATDGLDGARPIHHAARGHAIPSLLA